MPNSGTDSVLRSCFKKKSWNYFTLHSHASPLSDAHTLTHTHAHGHTNTVESTHTLLHSHAVVKVDGVRPGLWDFQNKSVEILSYKKVNKIIVVDVKTLTINLYNGC